MPTSRSIRMADGSTPMRLWARGPSGTFTASTPAALRARHCSSIGVASTPLGGTISTEVTSSPRASLAPQRRSEEHTSELQSQSNLVCRLLLEKNNIQLDAHVTHIWYCKG